MTENNRSPFRSVPTPNQQEKPQLVSASQYNRMLEKEDRMHRPLSFIERNANSIEKNLFLFQGQKKNVSSGQQFQPVMSQQLDTLDRAIREDQFNQQSGYLKGRSSFVVTSQTPQLTQNNSNKYQEALEVVKKPDIVESVPQVSFPFSEYEMKFLNGLQVISSKTNFEHALSYEGLPAPQREELRIAAMSRQSKEKILKQQISARQKNPYDHNEMINSQPNLPVVYQGGAYANGPELRDPRLNIEFTYFVKNKIDGEKFWVKFVTGENQQLQEVRWDLFEDAMLCYLQKTIIFNGEELDSINWNVFFGILFDQISRPENEQSPNPIYPHSTSYVNQQDKQLKYTGQKVRKTDWVSFIQNIGFKDYAKRCITEKNDVLEERFMHKLTQLKSSKRGQVTYEDGSMYDGVRENGRPNGRGTLVFPDNQGQYDGDFVSGRRHGYGIASSYLAEAPAFAQNKAGKKDTKAVEDHNMVYRGEWKNDQRHGYGIQEFYDGSRFEGQWEVNKQTYGTYVWPDGVEYSGDFCGPLLQGNGTMRLEDEMITGTWKDSKLEGKGERRKVNGDRYSGIWVKGRLQGLGEHSNADETYSGMYFNNRENGRGKKTFHKLGYLYEGTFKDGLFQGQGKQYYTNNDYYVGEFHQGLRHGKGIFRYANGDEYDGQWIENDQNGQGVMKSKFKPQVDGPLLQSTYTGTFKDCLFHGQGSFLAEDGQSYIGGYVNGMREGQGVLRYPTNDTAHEYFKEVGFEIYEGSFAHDLLHGHAKATYADGITYEGQWNDGKKCGRGVLRRHDYEIAGLFEEDLLVGPNWKDAIKAGDMNMKFLDYMFSLDKWQSRANDRLQPPVLPDNRGSRTAVQIVK